MYPLAVFDIWAWRDMAQVAKLDAQVVTGDFVHLNFALVNVIGAQADEDGVTPFLSTNSQVNIWQ